MYRPLTALACTAAVLVVAAGVASDQAPAVVGPDVSVTKTADRNPAIVGEPFTYLLRVQNGGDKVANGVLVTDSLPAGLQFRGVTTTLGTCTATSTTLTCDFKPAPDKPSRLDPGAAVDITIQVQANAAGNVVNTATVASSNDVDPSNNSGSATTQVTTRPTVSLSGDGTVNEGDTKTYSFSVSDPDAGDTFSVAAGYPRCGGSGALVAGSLQTSAGGGSFRCRFPDGDASSIVSIRVNDSAGAASNEAALTVAVANVAPTVALTGASTAGDGETKTYAFTVTDPGSDSSAVAPGYPRCGANGTLVPGSLQSTSSGGTFQCKFAAAGATASSVVAIKVTDSDGAASAEATIPVAVASAPAPPDTRADVALTKIESADPLPVGSALTYTLTVTNNGPATAENVRVVDPMPSGLTATSVSTTLGTCSGSTAVTCSLGSLEKSARATVQIAVQPAAVGSLVNTAAVTSTSPDNVATNNTATVETTVGPPGTVAVPVVPDTGPPHDVSRLRLRRGTTWLRLSWGLPTDKDLAGVVVTRTTSGSAKKLTLFRGRALGFTDRRVRAGARYSYRVRTYDTAGNTSRGVVAAGSPLQLPLFAPPPNARVTSPPLLRWRPVKRASYYNVQLFRNGQKLLSAWPRTPMLRLQSRWRFARHAFALSPGTYRWYVWPGYGERSLSHYGGLLGQSAFTVTRAA